LYIGVVATVAKGLHEFSATIVTDPGEVFLLNMYNTFQVMLIVLFILVGPLREIAMK
jgi:hypothetical protein